jgi:hypothetical protein
MEEARKASPVWLSAPTFDGLPSGGQTNVAPLWTLQPKDRDLRLFEVAFAT